MLNLIHSVFPLNSSSLMRKMLKVGITSQTFNVKCYENGKNSNYETIIFVFINKLDKNVQQHFNFYPLIFPRKIFEQLRYVVKILPQKCRKHCKIIGFQLKSDFFNCMKNKLIS